MDNFRWFKFDTLNWLSGKIRKHDFETKGAFIELCSIYWNKEEGMTCEDAIDEIGQEIFNKLAEKNIIECIDGYIFIKFLDEQREHCNNISEKRAEAGRKGGKRKANAKQMLSKTKQNQAEEKRREEIREEEIENREDYMIKKTSFVASNELLKHLKADEVWIKDIHEYTSINKKDILTKLNEFYKLIKAQKKDYRPFGEIQEHFVYWLKKNKPEEKTIQSY